ncbi:hypothetical protein THSYN_03585 [Candidatus Thiodictyon syntrophicum]|uniref:Uncharacterized protein n=1 Tax=Candidatus Thiodictyon syntrophicum TaxID=1166950 RepID=A0A2K8U3G8_9GAMM|nr:hypothetical protein THSYN_03585 [Candidatus Thiodictyon syntrophicum]
MPDRAPTGEVIVISTNTLDWYGMMEVPDHWRRVRRAHLERLRLIAAARLSVGAMVRTAHPTVAGSGSGRAKPLERRSRSPLRLDSMAVTWERGNEGPGRRLKPRPPVGGGAAGQGGGVRPGGGSA